MLEIIINKKKSQFIETTFNEASDEFADAIGALKGRIQVDL